MLLDIQSRLQENQLMELLAYSVYPDEDQLGPTIHEYETNSKLEIYGYVAVQQVIAVVGIEMKQSVLYIRHLSVHPDYRGLGYGRGILMELIEFKKPDQLIAEIDEDAVDFYRSVGFSMISLGEIYPGVEQFRCSYHTVED